MDQQSTQTVAQAVQAAARQQQAQQVQGQLAHTDAQLQTPQSAQSSTVDNLTCQWQGCGERCDNAETLYDHVCERHVGRKSTNNLNLTCQWGACRTTTVKRDHITSHIRVHVPLKPHKCEFCNKAFKRPQDLKKHVKTHADDSMLINTLSSPQPGVNGGRGGMGNGGGSYHPGSYDHSMTNPYPPPYQPNMAPNGANGTSYTHQQPNGAHYGGYGSVSYPNSSGLSQDIQSMDTRRRAFEALNDFLGDIKRRQIDPKTYYDVGQRLQSNALPLPVGGGYNTGYSNGGGYSGYSAASLLDQINSAGMGGGHGSTDGGGGGTTTQHGYALPLPNARTKDDLEDIDRFLTQLQTTVYETTQSASAAGIRQPGVHVQMTGEWGYNNNAQRASHSPPSFQNNAHAGNGAGMMSFGSMTAANMPSLTSAGSTDTPALTPASMSSHSSSGQSPLSSHGRESLASSNGNGLYPNLPSVTGISDVSSGYPMTTSAPAPSLASGFEGLDGRRYSGGRLQRERPGAGEVEMLDVDHAAGGARTPKSSHSKTAKGKGDSSIDPALRGDEDKLSPSSATTPVPGSESESAEDKWREEWVENIRVIESLRNWIAQRLSVGDFEAKTVAATNCTRDAREGATAEEEESKSVDIAKMVEERLATAIKAEAMDDLKYPTLPAS